MEGDRTARFVLRSGLDASHKAAYVAGAALRFLCSTGRFGTELLALHINRHIRIITVRLLLQIPARNLALPEEPVIKSQKVRLYLLKRNSLNVLREGG